MTLRKVGAVFPVSVQSGALFLANLKIQVYFNSDFYLENRARCEMIKLEPIPGGYCIFCNPSGRWETETG